MQIILIAAAGAAGALSRYGISSFAAHTLGDKFAYGTLIANIIGCFLLSLVMHISLSTDIITEQTRLAVTVGFLGALTTFSTFSYETFRYIEERAYLLAFGNITLNVLCGLLATMAGLILAKILIGES